MASRRILLLVLLGALVLWLPMVGGQPTESAGLDLPRGTILPWVPAPGVDQPPPGWLICDRETHEKHPWVPDLSGRFLMGATAAFPEVEGEGKAAGFGQFGGRSSHGHPGSRTPLQYAPPQKVERGGVAAAEAARSTHRHSVQIAPETHLPPYYTVVYIIRG